MEEEIFLYRQGIAKAWSTPPDHRECQALKYAPGFHAPGAVAEMLEDPVGEVERIVDAAKDVSALRTKPDVPSCRTSLNRHVAPVAKRLHNGLGKNSPTPNLFAIVP